MRSVTGDTLNPSLADRKRALYSSREFMASVECVVDSSSRIRGTPNNFVTLVPYGIRGIYAASLKSCSIPQNFGNVLSAQSFTVTYQNVVAFPANFTLPVGFYYLNLNQGTLNYTDITVTSSNNICEYIMINMLGAISSITVNPNTGSWNWVWDGTCGVVTSTDIGAFWQFLTHAGISWIGNGDPINLSGCLSIGIILPELSGTNSKSTQVGIPGYFASVPVTVPFGQVLAYVPIREDIVFLGGSKDLSNITVQLVDTQSNTVIPLSSDWTMALRLYVSQDQNS